MGGTHETNRGPKITGPRYLWIAQSKALRPADTQSFALRLEFLHFSRVGGLGEGAVGELEAQGLGAFGVVDHF
ncbi:MAG: hypothetical protein ABSF45_26435, partial [Terriglobia bacterium]